MLGIDLVLTIALKDFNCTLGSVLRTLGKSVKSHHKFIPSFVSVSPELSVRVKRFLVCLRF